jgi:hypothetical protein
VELSRPYFADRPFGQVIAEGTGSYVRSGRPSLIFCCGFLRKPHEGTFGMVAAWAFVGPLFVLGTMGFNTRRHHHRPALWAGWPFSRDRSWGCEPETEHVTFPSRAGALPKSQVHPEFTSNASPMRKEGSRHLATISLPPVVAGMVKIRIELAGLPWLAAPSLRCS